MTTIDPKDQAKLDQAAKLLGDNIPILLWELYKGLVDQGFSEHQALELCKSYIQAAFQSQSN